jgi:ADP-ribose pyrophosphatase YjhB (NUDIX family)
MAPEGTRLREDILRDTGFSLHDFLSHPVNVGSDDQPMFRVSPSCTLCGSSNAGDLTSLREAPQRFVCPGCGSIQHRNPRIVVRCIAERAGRVLLCQRADQPRRMRWSTPGGYLELGEDIHAAAARETEEEVGLAVDIVSLAGLYEFSQINEIFMVCTARVCGTQVTLGHESVDAKFFAPGEIPWNALAFPTDSEMLRRFCSRPLGAGQPIHYAQFLWEGDGRIMVRDR